MDFSSMPPGMPPKAFIGLGVFFVALPTLAISTRLGGNLKQIGKPSPGDYASIVAIILLAGMVANFILIVKALSNPSIEPTFILRLLRLVAASGPISAAATWVAKVPLLCVYIQLFGVKEWLRFASLITIAATFLYFFGWNAWLLITTLPISPDPQLLAQRTHAGSVAGVASASMALLTDIIILILPLPILLQLQLSLSKRMGLVLVFLTGIFAVIASTIGLYYKYLSLSGTPTDLTSAMVCTIVELSIAITVGCAPAIYTFWCGTVIKSTLFSKLSSAISGVSLLQSSQKGHTQQAVSSLDASSSHREHPNHRYDVLDDVKWREMHGKTLVSETTASLVPLQDLDPARRV